MRPESGAFVPDQLRRAKERQATSQLLREIELRREQRREAARDCRERIITGIGLIALAILCLILYARAKEEQLQRRHVVTPTETGALITTPMPGRFEWRRPALFPKSEA